MKERGGGGERWIIRLVPSDNMAIGLLYGDILKQVDLGQRFGLDYDRWSSDVGFGSLCSWRHWRLHHNCPFQASMLPDRICGMQELPIPLLPFQGFFVGTRRGRGRRRRREEGEEGEEGERREEGEEEEKGGGGGGGGGGGKRGGGGGGEKRGGGGGGEGRRGRRGRRGREERGRRRRREEGEEGEEEERREEGEEEEKGGGEEEEKGGGGGGGEKRGGGGGEEGRSKDLKNLDTPQDIDYVCDRAYL